MKQHITYKSVAFAVMLATLLISVGSLFFLGIAEKNAGDGSQPQRLFLLGSYKVDGDDLSRPLPDDGDLKLPDTSNKVTVVGRFDREIPAGELISFRMDNLHLRLWIDGVLACEYGAPYSTLPYVRSTGNGWQYFTSPGIGPEHEVRLELVNLYTNHPNAVYQSFFQQLYVGNPAAHIAQDLRAGLPRSIMAVFILLVGLLDLGYAIALLLKKIDANEHFALAGLSITYGVWCFIDFNTMGLFFPYPILNNAVQHLVLTLALCYALMYTATQLTVWRKFCVRATALATIAITLASVLCQHLGVLDYYDFSPFVHLLLGFSMAEMLVMLLLEYRAYPGRMSRRKLWPLGMLLLGGLASVLLNYLGEASFLLLETCFCLFIFCQLYFALRSVSSSAADKASISMLQADHERQQRLLEYEMLISRSTKGLYESIYELDITHNCAGGEGTRKYFESLGIPGDTPYDQALQHIVKEQIHPDYRQGYVEMFTSESVLKQYSKGIDTLQYDFLITQDGQRYYWMRIDARIFFWKDDESVRMITYRQNVDSEKRQELELLSRADQDSLTGLLNREALERKARSLLKNKPSDCGVCCIILDIDDFKIVNDTFGHMAGDFVLSQLSILLCAEFDAQDVIGRLGGDEFVVVSLCEDVSQVRAQVSALISTFATACTQFEDKLLPLSVSVGVAHLARGWAAFDVLYRRSDQALYQSKERGKRCYTVLEMEGKEP